MAVIVEVVFVVVVVLMAAVVDSDQCTSGWLLVFLMDKLFPGQRLH